MSKPMIALLFLPAALLLASCNNVTCGSGTVERGGKCVGADTTTGTAACGPFTMLEGNQCVPMFPPTVCDPSTTQPSLDQATGVITCIGTGGGGCNAPLACNPGSAGHQTICGQIYNFTDGTKFAASGATGTKCTSVATSGPCALGIQAYDAIAFAMNPAGATPLATADTYIDDCGRYRLTDIAAPSGPFIGLGLDDATPANAGPAGITNTVGVALPYASATATPNFEHFIVPAATTTSWQTTGGGSISTGYYVPVYRANCIDSTTAPLSGPGCTGDVFAEQMGVQFTKAGATEPANTFYFQAAQTTRMTVDTTATSTGANGTAIVNNATLADNKVYSGQNGITDTTNCVWDTKAGATVAGIVFIQVYRKVNKFGRTCTE